MKQLLNFSHPLSAQAKTMLEDDIGDGVAETVIPVQIDLESEVQQQLEYLRAAVRNQPADLYIPPGLSYAAAVVGQEMSQRPNPPAMVVLRGVGTPVALSQPGS